ncbi:hypothetical protein JCM11641_001372 [Rhodosporidiobolus odoratus]
MPQSTEKMLFGALQEYYKAGGFQDGPTSGVKSRIVFAASAVASVPLSVLRSAARSLHSDRSIPSNTVRLSIATCTVKVGSVCSTLVYEVKHALVKHFSGSAILPAIPGAVFPTSSPLHSLVSGVAGARFQGFSPVRGSSPPTYQINVAFSSATAFDSALRNPCTHHSSFPLIEYTPPPSLQSLVELRVDLRNLNIQDGPLSAAFAAVVAQIEGAALVVVPVTTTTSSRPMPELSGSLAVHSAHTFCPHCRFAGHDSEDCPSFPCNSCGQGGHTTATCSNPTGRKAVAHSGSAGWVKAEMSCRPPLAPHFNANSTPLGTASRYAALHYESETSSDDDGNSSAGVARDLTPSKGEMRKARYVEICDKRPPPTVSSSRTASSNQKRPRAHSPVPLTSDKSTSHTPAVAGEQDSDADPTSGRPLSASRPHARSQSRSRSPSMARSTTSRHSTSSQLRSPSAPPSSRRRPSPPDDEKCGDGQQSENEEMTQDEEEEKCPSALPFPSHT